MQMLVRVFSRTSLQTFDKCSECDGSVNQANILCKAEQQWKRALCYTHFASLGVRLIVDLGPQTLNCDVQQVMI